VAGSILSVLLMKRGQLEWLFPFVVPLLTEYTFLIFELYLSSTLCYVCH
jgi:hypothetical protein